MLKLEAIKKNAANLSQAETGRHLSHLFDPMMAAHTSNVEPLPHQITAMYELMLPRQPLRYVLTHATLARQEP